jgi:hypothetical protein
MSIGIPFGLYGLSLFLFMKREKGTEKEKQRKKANPDSFPRLTQSAV